MVNKQLLLMVLSALGQEVVIAHPSIAASASFLQRKLPFAYIIFQSFDPHQCNEGQS